MVLLESNNLFQELDSDDLERLRSATKEISYKPAQVIFKEGDPGDGIFFVKTGVVQISAVAGSAGSKVLSRIPAGELFGEMAVLDNQPRSATATAEELTTVYFISRPDMERLLDRVPRLAGALAREIIRRFRQFNREVLDSERLALVGRFASSIVHDLKNPLNIIGISADMAAMPTATAESRQISTLRIRKQVERISNMVNELLEFTQGANSNVAMALMDYQKFVLQLVEEIQAEVSLKSVTLQYDNKPPAVMVRLDPQRLSRVFHNLISNAADAMTSGGVIRLRFTESSCGLTTELQDSGPGIPGEMKDRLFQAFATHGKANGTGLGLSICKKIVNDHHGKIFAHNAPEGGAIFGFTLPVPSS